MRILGLIPARGGSKGLPGKNLKSLAGKSLLQWAFESATAAQLDRVILSTDDEAIAAAAKTIGLEVPFLRPAELGSDDTAMFDVVVHALDELERDGYLPDAVAILQPTSPFREGRHIRDAIRMLADSDSVCSVVQLPLHLSPDYLMKVEDGYLRHFLPDGDRITRRQDATPAFYRDGTVYLTTTKTIRAGSLYGERCVPMPLQPDESLSIDTVDDWDEAERRMSRRADGSR